MKLSQLIRTILNLLGVYTIFTAIVSGGMSVILIPVTMAFLGMERIDATGFSMLMVFFQFILPFTLGVLFIILSQRITKWVLLFSGINVDEETERLEINEFPFVAFSLLGLYMLSLTVPNLCQFIAILFQAKVQEASYMTTAEGGFLEKHLQNVVYHSVAVGFSFLVFMKGKSFARLALSLKTKG